MKPQRNRGSGCDTTSAVPSFGEILPRLRPFPKFVVPTEVRDPFSIARLATSLRSMAATDIRNSED